MRRKRISHFQRLRGEGEGRVGERKRKSVKDMTEK